MAGREFKVKKGLIVYSEGVDDVVLDVQGSQGQLFSVTDRLTGLLHSVNDISGIPIMEVYSDDRILMGTYGAVGAEISGSVFRLPNAPTASAYSGILVLENGDVKTASDISIIGGEPAFTKGSLIAGTGISLSGTLTDRLVGTGDVTIAHSDTSAQSSVSNTNGNVIQSVTLDTYGHITALASTNLDTRYSLTSHNHTLDSLSNVTITSNTNGEILRWNGTAWVNNTLAEAGIQAALTNPVTGTGTTNYLPKFTGSTTLGNSQIFDNGTSVGIGTTTPESKFHISEGDITIKGFNTSRFIRFSESANSYQGAFINYDGVNNIFYFGTHEAVDQLTTSDVRAFSIARNSANVTFFGNIIKSGGTSSQFLKADGSVDSTVYQPDLDIISLAELNTGTSTTERSVNAKNLNDWLSGVLSGANGYTEESLTYVASNTFTLSQANPMAINVYIHGQRKRPGLDYTVSGNQITFLDTLDPSFDIKVTYFYSIPGVGLSGGGTTNYIPKWNSTTSFTDSQIFDNGTNVGIGTNSPTLFFQIRKDSLYNTESNTSLGIDSGGANGSAKLLIGVDTTNDLSYIQSMQQFTGWNKKLVLQGMGGNVLIGTTNDDGTKLRVVGITNSDTIYAGGQITSSAAKLQVNGFQRTGAILLHSHTVPTDATSAVTTASGQLRNDSGNLTWESQRLYADNYHPDADKWTTARTLTIGNTGKSVNGSANVSWSLAEIGAQAAGNYILRQFVSDQYTDISNSDLNTFSTGVTYAGSSSTNRPPSGNSTILSIAQSALYGYQLGGRNRQLYWRDNENGVWNTWQRVFADDYHPNADTWTTARTITIGSTGKSVNGSANVSWSLAEIGAQAAGNYVTTDTTQTITGNKTFTNEQMTLSGHFYRNIYTPSTTAVYDHYYPNGGNGANVSIANLRVWDGSSSYKALIFSGGGSFTWDGNSVFHDGYHPNADTLTTARTINGTSFNGSANITTANWGTARTLTIGSTGKSVNGSANVSWSLTEIGAAAASHTHPASAITAGTFAAGDFTFQNALQVNGNNIRFASAKRTVLHNGHMYLGDIDNIGGNLYIRQAGIDVATVSGYNWTIPYDFTVNGRIVGVKGKLNTFYNNLGSPMIEEYALIHGQMTNKFRFISPALQEESIDGITWITSTRASSAQLGDLMRGEGEGTSFSAIPAPTLGGTGYYRLTWNASQTGYVALDKLYIYCSTNGNQVEFIIERKHNTNGWQTLSSGTLGNWPGHVFCPHSTIWFHPTATTHYGEVRITFRIVSAAYTNPFTLSAIEWFGGYPAGKRNAESYDRNKNVTFPNQVLSNAFVRIGGTSSQFLKADGSVDSTAYQIAGSYALSSHTHTKSNITDLEAVVEASTASTIVKRNGSGDINVRLVRSEYINQNTISGAIAYRVNNSTDNYIRFCSDTTAIKTWLGAANASHTHLWADITDKPSTFTPSLHTHSWSDIVSGKPTTLAGYGITDGGLATADITAASLTTTTLTLTRASGNITASVPTWNQNTTGSSAYLSTAGTYTTQHGTGLLGYTSTIVSTTTGLFPTSNNSNAVITLNRHSGNYYSQLGFNADGGLFYRSFNNVAINTTQAWQRVFADDYHPNADTLTTARTLTIGSTGKTFNGSANVSWSLAEIGAAAISHSHLLGDLSNVILTTPANGQVLQYNGTNWVNASLASGGVTSVATGTGLTGGPITSTGTIAFDTTWGDGRYVTLTSTQTISGAKTFSQAVSHNTSSSRDKYRLYSTSEYAIGMQSGVTFGGIANDWAMTFQFNNASTRGFWWGDSAHTTAQGAMALSTNGYLTVASGIRVGYGESDTTVPTIPLDVNGNAAIQGQIYSPTVAKGNSGTAVTFNWNDGNIQTVTMTGNATFTFSNPQSGASYQIIITQDATGSRTITWPTIYWESDIAPTLTGTANSIDIVTLTYDGSKYLGVMARNFGTP